MGSAFLKSLAFGIFIAASIGPIALLIIATAANRGLWHGSLAGLGAALADLVYAFLAFSVGALLLPLLATWTVAIRAGSALVLIVLAIAMIRRDFTAAALAPGAPPRPTGSLLPTFLLTLVNPLTLVMFAGFTPQLPLAGSLATAGWLALGLFCGSLLTQFALALAGSLLGVVLPDRRWRRAIKLAGASGILAFGLAGLFSLR